MRKFIVRLVASSVGMFAALVVGTTPASAAAAPVEHISASCHYVRSGWSCKGHSSWGHITSSRVATIAIHRTYITLHRPKGSLLHVTASVADYHSAAGDFAVRIHWLGRHKLPLHRMIDGRHVRLAFLRMTLRG
jgi:hypothetical protein